jgi:hypothetical protein
MKTNKEYKNNTEPKVGDLVRFKSHLKNSNATHRVVSVLGGRLGNKIGVVPAYNTTTWCQEYYYYCFVKA